MNKRFAGVLAAASAALLLAGCASGGETDTNNQGDKGTDSSAPAGLVNDGFATACIDPEYPPLEYYEDGSGGDIIGFDADAVRALAEHWGVEPKFEVTSFDGLMPGLQSSRCDFIFGGLYMSEERLQIADAAPIMNAGPAALAAPELAAKLKSPEDLCGLKVTSQAASSNAASVDKLSEECVADGKAPIQHTQYPKTAETVLAVLNGKSDVLVETNVAAAYMATQNQGKLEVAGVFDPDTTFGVFTRKDDQLSPAVADGLKALYEDGTWAKIAEKYNLDAEILDVY
ncbi:ABC transporter substrate-binding protein [Ruicaihuangia caeni]|uniref:ABC transporter substrate-binding protein n=1 Tax=Ruicaihuangia caeni TaxID=3042517 RepID=A0AAW6TA15_9MICO|nr:ABC transporter substrate-binding protein [Klugiella sp. YN-L-19]MDI2099178.1 ABC transporter substrate-binding protein [Klugiella sp. YN-L-19]